MTPPLAFGAAVVAVAAFAYGSTQTSLDFARTPESGNRCGGCAPPSPEPAATRGPVPTVPPRPPVSAPPGLPRPARISGTQPTADARAAATATPGPTRTPAGGAGSPPAAAATTSPRPGAAGVTLDYVTQQSWSGGFVGAITIVNGGDKPIDGWTLKFGYPGALVDSAWNVVFTPLPDGVQLSSGQGASAIQPGASVRVWFSAVGRPGSPTGCVFNGRPCEFS